MTSIIQSIKNWYYQVKYNRNNDFIIPGDTEDISYKFNDEEMPDGMIPNSEWEFARKDRSGL